MNQFFQTFEGKLKPAYNEHQSISDMQQEPHFTDIQFHNQDLYSNVSRSVSRVHSTP
ncbi:hypothetical protein [Cohnella sp.]|uniref:hypothetical protein n=1 Tax=Cohnella sp. TaxID=1883426 RepID=UPI0035671249